MREGVIQFELDHTEAPLRPGELDRVGELLGWRAILQDTGLLGAEPGRYDGLGFGNISARTSARGRSVGERAFVISGSQTAGETIVGADHFVVVSSWSVARNHIESRGPVVPSSESLTHATIYDRGPHITTVFHVHSPDIFRAHRTLGLPSTPSNVDYGTTAMAAATSTLFRAGRVLETRCFVMLGHEDGVVAFGKTPDEAGTVLMRTLAASRKLLR